MNKRDLLTTLGFPEEWIALDMYPDELFEWQRSGYRLGHEQGSEHDRNGAFHWWLRRRPTHDQLEKLLRLAAIEPDPHLGNDVRICIAKAEGFDDALRQTERSLLGGQ